MKRCIYGFVLMAVVGRAARADDQLEAEVKKLDGTWDLKAVEVLGKQFDAPDLKGGQISFSKDMKLNMIEPCKPEKRGTYKIDASKSPKHMDLIGTKDGKDGDVIQTIYEVEKDKLRIAFSAEDLKGERPSRFKGDKVVILHWKRHEK